MPEICFTYSTLVWFLSLSVTFKSFFLQSIQPRTDSSKANLWFLLWKNPWIKASVTVVSRSICAFKKLTCARQLAKLTTWSNSSLNGVEFAGVVNAAAVNFKVTSKKSWPSFSYSPTAIFLKIVPTSARKFSIMKLKKKFSIWKSENLGWL